MFCPKCGTKLEKDASFCPECGEKIERSPTELFPKKQVHKSRFKRITFSCNNKWDYIWIAVFVVLVVAAGSKMVSSLVKASYNITYADNSSSSYTRNEISSKSSSAKLSCVVSTFTVATFPLVSEACTILPSPT